jgi:type VI protein secretion system component Hcp
MALFTKYDSVEGSSTADGFDKMVQTTSLQIKSSRTGQYEQSLAKAQQRTTGNAVMGPITITQDVDKAYPKNCENMLGGKNCKKIEVFETLTVGGKQATIMKFVFEDCLFTGVSLETDGLGKSFAKVEFQPTKMEITYTEHDTKTGDKKGDVVGKFDASLTKAG